MSTVSAAILSLSTWIVVSSGEMITASVMLSKPTTDTSSGDEGPAEGLSPLKSEWDVPCAGVQDQYYLYYYGFNQSSFRIYNMRPGVRYHVDVIDTWNMTVEEQPGVYEGSFRIELPGRQYMALRLRKA